MLTGLGFWWACCLWVKVFGWEVGALRPLERGLERRVNENAPLFLGGVVRRRMGRGGFGVAVLRPFTLTLPASRCGTDRHASSSSPLHGTAFPWFGVVVWLEDRPRLPVTEAKPEAFGVPRVCISSPARGLSV